MGGGQLSVDESDPQHQLQAGAPRLDGDGQIHEELPTAGASVCALMRIPLSLGDTLPGQRETKGKPKPRLKAHLSFKAHPHGCMFVLNVPLIGLVYRKRKEHHKFEERFPKSTPFLALAGSRWISLSLPGGPAADPWSPARL